MTICFACLLEQRNLSFTNQTNLFTQLNEFDDCSYTFLLNQSHASYKLKCVFFVCMCICVEERTIGFAEVHCFDLFVLFSLLLMMCVLCVMCLTLLCQLT